MRKLLTLFFGDPKNVVLNSKEDIQKHADKLSMLTDEEKEILADYLAHAEMNQRLPGTAQNLNYQYGVSVGQAIDKQKCLTN
ncbi:hypothetical protein [Neisseria wadsworthii]|uniref:hypothetical protein n=1 Tax=Neisseria wadsworthii TaxID=607711 RepID=UPI000D2FA496|nr:hypothetical protein [Neisseria wadsworthii]